MKHRMNFQRKLFFYYSVVIISIIITIFSVFYLYAYNTLSYDMKNNLDKLSQLLSVQTDNLFSNMDKIALYVSSNPQMRKAFNKALYTDMTNNELEVLIMQTLLSVSVPNSNADFRISLYNIKGNFISTGIELDREAVRKHLKSSEYKEWYNKLPIQTNRRVITPPHYDYWSYNEEKYISLFREIYNIPVVTNNTAVIEIQYPLKSLEEILKAQQSNDFSVYLYTEKGELAYSSKADAKYASDLYAHYKKNMERSKNNHVFRQDFYSAIRSDYTDWVLVLTQPRQHISTVLVPLMFMVLLLGIFVLTTGMYTIFLISNRITKPLKELRQSVHEVSMANLSLEVGALEVDDEFSELNFAFDKMFERLKLSLDEVVEIRTHEIKAHMIALQAQMDPHFLYNVIAVIKAMSREGDGDRIRRVCDYLASMLRYITSFNEEYITAVNEIEHVKNYLRLMKVRFEDQLEYDFEIDEGIQQIKIPKLSLQPIVENCFGHGFKEVLPPWRISIRCWIETEKWYVTIKDNGIGISEETIKDLFDKVEFFLKNPSQNISHLKLGGMGLINTIARLKLKYKDDIVFEISSLPQGGTCITIGGLVDYEHSTS